MQSTTQPQRLLMVDPEFFDVTYVINPHMAGQVGKIDRKKTRAQWQQLKLAYEKIGFTVAVLPGEPGLPDMVFAANQSFPFLNANDQPAVIMSRMATPERSAEVQYFTTWYRREGYPILSLQSEEPFEGMGDLLWHPGQKMLWGGWGFRTSAAAYKEIAILTGAQVKLLELVNPEFYHLDTCLAPLNETTALYVPSAFTVAGKKELSKSFADLVEVPLEEAAKGFACNAHCPDGKHVLLHQGCKATCRLLRERGLEPVELDTSEFLKAGGSVFCMKMMVY